MRVTRCCSSTATVELTDKTWVIQDPPYIFYYSYETFEKSECYFKNNAWHVLNFMGVRPHPEFESFKSVAQLETQEGSDNTSFSVCRHVR